MGADINVDVWVVLETFSFESSVIDFMPNDE
jgi:hypothetical protein